MSGNGRSRAALNRELASWETLIAGDCVAARLSAADSTL